MKGRDVVANVSGEELEADGAAREHEAVLYYGLDDANERRIERVGHRKEEGEGNVGLLLWVLLRQSVQILRQLAVWVDLKLAISN